MLIEKKEWEIRGRRDTIENERKILRKERELAIDPVDRGASVRESSTSGVFQGESFPLIRSSLQLECSSIECGETVVGPVFRTSERTPELDSRCAPRSDVVSYRRVCWCCWHYLKHERARRLLSQRKIYFKTKVRIIPLWIINANAFSYYESSIFSMKQTIGDFSVHWPSITFK